MEQRCLEGAGQGRGEACGTSRHRDGLFMRHSAITDLISGGLAILTAAPLIGTSVAMIEKHYGHLRADDAADALAALAV